MNKLEKAIMVATLAHEGQLDIRSLIFDKLLICLHLEQAQNIPENFKTRMWSRPLGFTGVQTIANEIWLTFNSNHDINKHETIDDT